ncbi:MAG: hypothetical protein ACTSO2_16705 [Promethearchaeota archaeon]
MELTRNWQKILCELGYIADCSVTPGIFWEKTLGNPRGKGGPNFIHADIHPYFLNSNDVIHTGKSNLLEIPITILFIKCPFVANKFWQKIYLDALTEYIKNSKYCFFRILRKLKFCPVWFRPYSNERVKTLIQVYKSAKRLNLEYIQMILHSSELMPGGSPYNKDDNSIERLYKIINNLFRVLSQDLIESVTLAEYAKKIHKERNIS